MSRFLNPLLAFVRPRPWASALVLLALVAAGVGGWLWRQRLEAVRRHDAARQRGEEMLRSLTDYPRVTADLNAANRALQFVDRGLITERALERNLGYFYQIETVAHVRLLQINQQGSPPSAPGSPFRVVPFTLQATGSYPQLVNFLRQLESGPLLLRITRYSLGRGDPRTGSMILDASVEALASQ